jgi:hypothetical protein
MVKAAQKGYHGHRAVHLRHPISPGEGRLAAVAA